MEEETISISIYHASNSDRCCIMETTQDASKRKLLISSALTDLIDSAIPVNGYI